VLELPFRTGLVVRTSASYLVDLASIPSFIVRPGLINLVFTASLLDVQYWRDGVEINPASSLVVTMHSQGKALT